MMTTFAYLIVGSSLLLANESGTADKPAAKKAIPKAEFTNAGHTVDDVKDVEQFVKEKRAVLLDVREQDEWDAGRLKLAKLVPLSKLQQDAIPEKLLKKLPKDKPIYLHCRSGGRVLMVAEILKSKGYDIRPLRSGYEKLLKAGFDKATPKDVEEMDAEKKRQSK